jgi:RHS repeat-associated protein
LWTGFAVKSDSDAGLLKVGCRYYDPQLGAFTSRDTELDQVPYLYCEHDPINAVDPSGHDFWNDFNTSVGSYYGPVIGIGVGKRIGRIVGRKLGGTVVGKA